MVNKLVKKSLKFNGRFKDFYSPSNWCKTFEFQIWGAFDSAKNHKRQLHKRLSVTAKREEP